MKNSYSLNLNGCICSHSSSSNFIILSTNCDERFSVAAVYLKEMKISVSVPNFACSWS